MEAAPTGPETEPCNPDHPFTVRQDVIWHFHPWFMVLDHHNYDGGQVYGEFLYRCGYTTYLELVDVGQEETISFLQAHTYSNLCAYVAGVFGKPFDLEHDLLKHMEVRDEDEAIFSPTSRAVDFIVALYHHIRHELGVKGELEFHLEEKANKLMDALESSCTTLQFFLEILRSNANGGEPRWPELYHDTYEIYLSCLILGEHLEGLYFALLTPGSVRRAPREWPDASYLFHSSLVASGWCPREVQTFALQPVSATVIAYLRNMHNPRTARKHKECTPQHCPYETVDAKSYRTQHVVGCLGCEDINLGGEASRIIQCFEKG